MHNNREPKEGTIIRIGVFNIRSRHKDRCIKWSQATIDMERFKIPMLAIYGTHLTGRGRRGCLPYVKPISQDVVGVDACHIWNSSHMMWYEWMLAINETHLTRSGRRESLPYMNPISPDVLERDDSWKKCKYIGSLMAAKETLIP